MEDCKTPRQRHCLDMCWRLVDMLNKNWCIANGYDYNDSSKWKFTFEFMPVYAMYVFNAVEAKISYGKPFVNLDGQIVMHHIVSSGQIGGELIKLRNPNDAFEYMIQNYCKQNNITFQALENLLYN